MDKPHFPVIIFLVAATLDLIIQPIIFAVTFIAALPAVIPVVGTAIAAVLMIMAYLFGVFISGIFIIILILWRASKHKIIRKDDRGRFILRLILMFFIGSIPGARFFIPENVAIVVLTHHREVQIWKKYMKQQAKTQRAASDNRRQPVRRAVHGNRQWAAVQKAA